MLLGLTLVAAAAGGWWIYEGGGRRRTSDGLVAASGRIEVERVHLAPATAGRACGCPIQ
jgi:hypothetical protein